MQEKKFPEDSTGTVHGPDGPLRRTRAHTLVGFVEPVEKRPIGRNKAWMDEESAFLNTRSFEE